MIVENFLITSWSLTFSGEAIDKFGNVLTEIFLNEYFKSSIEDESFLITYEWVKFLFHPRDQHVRLVQKYMRLFCISAHYCYLKWAFKYVYVSRFSKKNNSWGHLTNQIIIEISFEIQFWILESIVLGFIFKHAFGTLISKSTRCFTIE